MVLSVCQLLPAHPPTLPPSRPRTRRAGSELSASGNTQALATAIGLLPAVWLTINVLRFVCFAFFNYVIELVRPGSGLPLPEVTFASCAGLRGSVSLIMGQAIIHETKHLDLPVVRGCLPACLAGFGWQPGLAALALRHPGWGRALSAGGWRWQAKAGALGATVPGQAAAVAAAAALPAATHSTLPHPTPHTPHTALSHTRTPLHALQAVKAQMIFWTAGFVLLTLTINAPLLPSVLRWTGLAALSPGEVRRRRQLVAALAAHTEEVLDELRQDEEMLAGGPGAWGDWAGAGHRLGWSWAWWWCSWWWWQGEEMLAGEPGAVGLGPGPGPGAGAWSKGCMWQQCSRGCNAARCQHTDQPACLSARCRPRPRSPTPPGVNWSQVAQLVDASSQLKAWCRETEAASTSSLQRFMASHPWLQRVATVLCPPDKSWQEERLSWDVSKRAEALALPSLGLPLPSGVPGAGELVDEFGQALPAFGGRPGLPWHRALIAGQHVRRRRCRWRAGQPLLPLAARRRRMACASIRG